MKNNSIIVCKNRFKLTTFAKRHAKVVYKDIHEYILFINGRPYIYFYKNIREIYVYANLELYDKLKVIPGILETIEYRSNDNGKIKKLIKTIV